MGCLLGKDSVTGFQWYKGAPSFWKDAFPHGESIGETDLLSETYVLGKRCGTCRKIVLDY